MGRSFDEGGLRFVFGDAWQVEKYDEHRDYREKVGRLPGSKAVDFVGILDSHDCYLIEVKDFRGHQAAMRQQLSGDLEKTVALKVRDSIAGLIGAFRTSSEPDLWQPFARALANRCRAVRIHLGEQHQETHRLADNTCPGPQHAAGRPDPARIDGLQPPGSGAGVE